MNKIGFLEFFGSFLQPHNLRPALADAKIVAGELDRESRSLEAEVEVRQPLPDAAKTALEQLLQEHYGFRQVRLRFLSAVKEKSSEQVLLGKAIKGKPVSMEGLNQDGQRCGGGQGVFCRLPRDPPPGRVGADL